MLQTYKYKNGTIPSATTPFTQWAVSKKIRNFGRAVSPCL